MGCSGSKLEELEAVALCCGRTDLIADAIRHRYALADAHAAYSLSLRSVGASLHRFHHSAGGQETLSSSSPVLPLPTQRKGDPLPPPCPSPPPAAHSRSHSGSGSHIQFHSSDDDDDGDSEISPFHSGNSSPNHHRHRHHLEEQRRAETLGRGPTFNFHYASNQPQPPTVQFASVGGLGGGGGDPSSSSYYSAPPPAYPNYGNDPYSYPYPYPTNNFYGFFGNSSSSPPPNLAPPPAFGSAVGESSGAAPKPPPPPPSPPRVSAWNILNPFEAPDSYYPPYTPSRSSREVRDEEGIPDLEDEEEDHEVVKEVYGEQKFAGSTSGEYKPNAEGIANIGKNSRSVEVENEEDVVEKKVVAGEVQRPPAAPQNVAASSKPRQYHNVSEIRIQFEKASEAVAELSKMLEVGKQPYRHRKSSVVEGSVSSMMMCVMPPSTSNGEDFLNFEEDIAASSKYLSSTLQKLYIWEKKLQDEVRAEEKMRLLHDQNCKRLRHLVERGAEGHKLEEAQKMIKKMSTKIRIAIQIVDSISNKINKLRDEELWPQINELIHGLVTMWKVMLECHRIQCQAISEAKGLDSIATGSKLDDTRLSAIVDLELELLRWTGNFASWISAQKNYVKALNGWLVLCLHYEPEVTDDGVVPYSPGRIGAPPVFVICNYWSQAVDRISEVEVINAMQTFTTNLRHLWEQHSVDPQHKMTLNGDMDRLVRAREREAQIIHKEVDELNRKLVLVSGQNDLPGHSAEVSSLQLGLKQIFEAMENFTANSLKSYEELRMRSEEESG